MKTESAVWERVNARDGITAEQALLPERLAELMMGEAQLAAAFSRLAGRLSGADGAMMRRLRAQGESRVRRLRTEYYLLSGMRADIRPPEVPFYPSICEALRAQCQSLLTLQKKYDETAREFPACAALPEESRAALRQTRSAVIRILEKHL